MSEKLKTDLALFGAAFIALVLVLGANTTVETWLGAIIAAR
jgi:hypothetical protein